MVLALVRICSVVAGVAMVGACVTPEPAPIPPRVEDQRIDEYALRESRWVPLDQMLGGGEVIRIASVQALIWRSYVQIVKTDAGATLELTNVRGRKMTRTITDQQWAELVALEERSRSPVDEKAVAAHVEKVVRPTGHCHGGDQIETYLGGRRGFISASVCQGPATRRWQDFAEGINRVALQSFPECGSAAEPYELVEKLAYCPPATQGSSERPPTP